ncbi:MAG: bifunctional chorismate mutase/prephenate dehydratase [Christensenellales bacterium]
MKDIRNLRKEINEIDLQMASLFEKRMNVCKEIAVYKKENGLSVRDKVREEEVIKNNSRIIESPEIRPYYVEFIRNAIDISCEYQSAIVRDMRVSYCGTEGAFAHVAAGKMFPSAEFIAYPDFRSAYSAVEKGECDCAVLPIENSYAGEVGTVTDLMFSGDLFINEIIDVPVEHCLMTLPGTKIEDIRKVISHPQALAQCERFIEECGFETQSYSNTALAAEFVSKNGDKTVAAIASEDTAAIFGLEIIKKPVNDNGNNTTRFASFSRTENKPVSGAKREDENFILVFTVQNESGALAGALNIIGAHGFNMRTLRSRPMKNLKWNYYFYIEAEGNVHTENGRDMMRELSALCAKLKLVGSYFSDSTEDIL